MVFTCTYYRHLWNAQNHSVTTICCPSQGPMSRLDLQRPTGRVVLPGRWSALQSHDLAIFSGTKCCFCLMFVTCDMWKLEWNSFPAWIPFNSCLKRQVHPGQPGHCALNSCKFPWLTKIMNQSACCLPHPQGNSLAGSGSPRHWAKNSVRPRLWYSAELGPDHPGHHNELGKVCLGFGVQIDALQSQRQECHKHPLYQLRFRDRDWC